MFNKKIYPVLNAYIDILEKTELVVVASREFDNTHPALFPKVVTNTGSILMVVDVNSTSIRILEDVVNSGKYKPSELIDESYPTRQCPRCRGQKMVGNRWCHKCHGKGEI